MVFVLCDFSTVVRISFLFFFFLFVPFSLCHNHQQQLRATYWVRVCVFSHLALFLIRPEVTRLCFILLFILFIKGVHG